MADDKKKQIIITPIFRGSYVHLVKPKSFEEGQEPEYSITIVLPKASAETKQFIAKLRAAITAACVEKLGGPQPDAKLKHFPIKDGDLEDEDYFHGNFTIRAKNSFKPGAIDLKGNKLFSEDDLYSGAWYRASIDVWAWKGKFGQGVSVNLNNVQKVKDDERFGGGSDATNDFAQYIEGGEGGDAPAEDGGDLGI